MRICHLLASHAELGGLEKHVFEVAGGQVKLGHEVTVVLSPEMAGYAPGGVGTVVVDWKRGRWDPRLRGELRRVLGELNPEVVHAQAHKAVAVAAKVVPGLGLPLVGTAHNIKKKARGFDRCDAVTVPSGRVADSVKGVDCEVVWNAVEAPKSEWVERARLLEPPYLGGGEVVFYAAGRLVDAKGYDVLLDALSGMEKGRLWLVGDGPEREALGVKIRELGLEERVWFPGALPIEEVRGLMGLAGCFVISSRREGGPYTLSEALRARCAVVSTRVGFVPEFLSDEQMCEGEAGSLRGLMERFAADPVGYGERMGVVFEVAERELDLGRMVEKVVGVYEGVLASRSS